MGCHLVATLAHNYPLRRDRQRLPRAHHHACHTWAIGHTEKVAGTAERTTTGGKRRSYHALPYEGVSPNAFGIAEARDVIFAPPCNHWARAFHRTSVARRARCPWPVRVVDLREAFPDALACVEQVVDEAL